MTKQSKWKSQLYWMSRDGSVTTRLVVFRFYLRRDALLILVLHEVDVDSVSDLQVREAGVTVLRTAYDLQGDAK